MDLVRAWAVGAAVWVAWASIGASLHLWLLPLGALDVPHVRLSWIAFTTLTGYFLVTLACAFAHAHSHRARVARRLAATCALPALGVPLEAAALLRPEGTAADAAAFGAAVAAIAAGTALATWVSRMIRARGAPLP